jgi:ArsR family transcriptional regulator, arsenate/arsenite/antimonite-responsive transcriptional repressor
LVWSGVETVTVELPVLSPRERKAAGCCTPLAMPQVEAAEARDLAAVCKALGDPTRVLIVDALRAAAPEAVCQCELLPLFEMSQPALAKHLKVLVGAGVAGTERRGLWAYYFLLPDTLKELRSWLS